MLSDPVPEYEGGPSALEVSSRSATSCALPDFSGLRILVVGDVMLDRYWFGDATRISPEAPVPVVSVGRQEARAGGAANVAANVAALGATVQVIGVAGRDDAAIELESLLQARGVTANLVKTNLAPTTTKLRVVARQQQLVRIDVERVLPAGAAKEVASLVRACASSFDAFILSDYAKGTLAEVGEIIASVRLAGRPILVDPKGDDFDRYSGATLLTPNRQELRAVIGAWRDESDLRARAEALRRRLDVSALLVTRSEDGMTLFHAGACINEPARAREVFDVSGAGDTVISLLGLMMAAGADWPRCVHVANAAAGIVVGKLGTAIVSREELVDALG